MLDTHFLTVRDVARSRSFYSDVLGGEVVLAENPCIVRLANSWIIMNPGGGPTPDKPEVTLVPPEDPSTASCFLNLRVADIQTSYRDWSAKGATFLTPPIDRKAEVRCYILDPDGYLIVVGQATGMRHSVFADRPLERARVGAPERGHGLRRSCIAASIPHGDSLCWRASSPPAPLSYDAG